MGCFSSEKYYIRDKIYYMEVEAIYIYMKEREWQKEGVGGTKLSFGRASRGGKPNGIGSQMSSISHRLPRTPMVCLMWDPPTIPTCTPSVSLSIRLLHIWYDIYTPSYPFHSTFKKNFLFFLILFFLPSSTNYSSSS